MDGCKVTRFNKVAEQVLNTLKAEGIYEKDLHYRGFSADRIPAVLKTGTDRATGNEGRSEIWYIDDATRKLDSTKILYATKEGNRLKERVAETCSWGNLEDAIACSTSCANQEGLSALSVYRGNDLIIIRESLGEYQLKDAAMPLAIIRLLDESSI